MSHYLYYSAIELGKNNTTRGNKQSYLTIYSITFITTGCICTCQVKVSDPCSHESFSVLMKTTPMQRVQTPTAPADDSIRLTLFCQPELTGEAPRLGGIQGLGWTTD